MKCIIGAYALVQHFYLINVKSCISAKNKPMCTYTSLSVYKFVIECVLASKIFGVYFDKRMT